MKENLEFEKKLNSFPGGWCAQKEAYVIDFKISCWLL
jgi:hypothetical protein